MKSSKSSILNYFGRKRRINDDSSFATDGKNIKNKTRNSRRFNGEKPSTIIVISSDDDDDFECVTTNPKKKLNSKRRFANNSRDGNKITKSEQIKKVSEWEQNVFKENILPCKKSKTVTVTEASIGVNKNSKTFKDCSVNNNSFHSPAPVFEIFTSTQNLSSLNILSNNTKVNKTDNACASSEKENKISELDEPDNGTSKYYVQNFLTILNCVLNNECDKKLFDTNDCDDLFWAETFKSLSINQQKVYVRLYNRKVSWLRIDKIKYADISCNLDDLLESLVKNNFLLSLSNTVHKEEADLGEVLNLLPVSALKDLAKVYHIKEKQKFKIVPALIKMCQKQRNAFSGSVKSKLIKKACQLTGKCYKLAPKPKRAFNRFLLVFDVTRGIDDDVEGSCGGSVANTVYKGKFGQNHMQLSAMMLSGMGMVKYPDFKINRSNSIFAKRQHLLEYESASQLQSDAFYAIEINRNFEAGIKLCLEAQSRFQNLSKEYTDFVNGLPDFLQCFSSAWIYIRTLSALVEVYEKQKKYNEAVSVLNVLLEQPYCKGRRGKWWERLALNLHQHLKQNENAIEVIAKASKDKELRVGHKLALGQRALNITKSKYGQSQHFQENLQKKLQPAIQFLEITPAPEVTIYGKQLRYDTASGIRSSFVIENDDEERTTSLCSVEEFALNHYKSLGFDKGQHGEGGSFFTLFCLLMWDIVFSSDVEDVFRNEYQTHPLDFYTDGFYTNRKGDIDNRLKLLCESIKSENIHENNPIYKILCETWDKYNGISCSGMSWDRFSSVDSAWSLIQCLGGQVLSSILFRMVKDLRHTRSGLPDLIVWNTTDKTHKFVEVKGPGDRLSNNQIMWLHELIKYGADAEVCYVKANASKSKFY